MCEPTRRRWKKDVKVQLRGSEAGSCFTCDGILKRFLNVKKEPRVHAEIWALTVWAKSENHGKLEIPGSWDLAPLGWKESFQLRWGFFIRNPSATTISNEINFILINFFSHSPSPRALFVIPDIFSQLILIKAMESWLKINQKNKREKNGEQEIGSKMCP